MKRCEAVECKLPDGETIALRSQRFRCAEPLFRPSLLGMATEVRGLHEMVYSTIQLSDRDLQRDLWGNIVLSGGGSLFEGLKERMESEARAVAPCGWRTRIEAWPERAFSSWIGGSILGSMAWFQDKWITKEEYYEVGPNIVQVRCF